MLESSALLLLISFPETKDLPSAGCQSLVEAGLLLAEAEPKQLRFSRRSLKSLSVEVLQKNDIL